jgi:hypothetical protein
MFPTFLLHLVAPLIRTWYQRRPLHVRHSTSLMVPPADLAILFSVRTYYAFQDALRAFDLTKFPSGLL